MSVEYSKALEYFVCMCVHVFFYVNVVDVVIVVVVVVGWLWWCIDDVDDKAATDDNYDYNEIVVVDGDGVGWLQFMYVFVLFN